MWFPPPPTAAEPVPLPLLRAPRFCDPVPGTQGRARPWARRTPCPKTRGRLCRGGWREPGGGVRQVRSSPGRRLPGAARGPRGRTQVRRKQSRTKPATPPGRRVHAGQHRVSAAGRDGWEPSIPTSRARAGNRRPFRGRRRGPGRAGSALGLTGTSAAGSARRDAGAEAAVLALGLGSGQGALQARRRGARGGSHVGHL